MVVLLHVLSSSLPLLLHLLLPGLCLCWFCVGVGVGGGLGVGGIIVCLVVACSYGSVGIVCRTCGNRCIDSRFGISYRLCSHIRLSIFGLMSVWVFARLGGL